MALITGRVLDRAGAGVAGARLMLAEVPAGAPDIAMLTGADGAFTIGASAPGRYVLRAVDDTHGEASAAVEVGTGIAEAALTIRLPG